MGKSFDVELETGDADEAAALLDEITRRLLANTVIEDYEIQLGS